MDFYKEGKSAAKDALKDKDTTICELTTMGNAISKDLKLKGSDKKDFNDGWDDAIASSSRKRKNPGCPLCARHYKRLRRR